MTYPDAGAFLEARFGSGASPEFGTSSDDIGKALAAGRATASNGKRDAAYAKVNDAIRSDIPLIPIARSATNAAYRADVEGAATSPLGLERFAAMVPGDRRQFVWLTTGEPAGLYCADETDSVSALICTQLSEGLYGYDPTSAAPVPVPGQGLRSRRRPAGLDLHAAEGRALPRRLRARRRRRRQQLRRAMGCRAPAPSRR